MSSNIYNFTIFLQICLFILTKHSFQQKLLNFFFGFFFSQRTIVTTAFYLLSGAKVSEKTKNQVEQSTEGKTVTIVMVSDLLN